MAGEIGHTTIDLNGRHCKCGNYGCLEAYASAPAIATRAREVLVREEGESPMPAHGATATSTRSRRRPCTMPRRQGDAIASEIVRDTARYLGAGIANLLNIFNPDIVVVAGGVTAAGDALFVPLRAEVRRRAFSPAVQRGAHRARRAARHGGRRRRGGELQAAAAGWRVSRPRRARTAGRARCGTKQRVGVIGTFVWDVIHGRDARAVPVEEWGGITYTLAGLDAALPDDWEIVPILKVGDDLAERARAITSARCGASRPTRRWSRCRIPDIASSCATSTTSGAPRCSPAAFPAGAGSALKPLHRRRAARRAVRQLPERLGARPRDRAAAAAALPGPDPLRPAHDGDGGAAGRAAHAARRSPTWRSGARCFDFLQMNEDEMATIAPDPMSLAATAIAAGVSCLLVTLGKRGAVYVAAPGFDTICDLPPRARTEPRRRAAARARSARCARRWCPRALSDEPGDPTGCGDVCGATYFSRMLAGDKLSDAMTAAALAAARNVGHRGATGLAAHLRGELSLS